MSLPELFGPYLLHHRLARGSASEVFLAQTLGEFPRLCAVKRIAPEVAGHAAFGERFREEAALLTRLIHGNLVQVLDVGSVEERPFVAMELIDGVDLGELVIDVPTRGPLAPETALFVGLELCEGLGYLQIKRREQLGRTRFALDRTWPLQLMLSFDGNVKLIDLGTVSTLQRDPSAPERSLRNPGFCAPEVVRGGDTDARTDLFVVGLALWELLCGRRLAADGRQYVDAVRCGSWKAPPVQRKDVPGGVIRLVSRLLAAEPERRPTSLDEVRRQLVDALRRSAPTFGSANLAALLMRRCSDQIGQLAQLTERVRRRAATEQRATPAGHTLSFGRDVQPAPAVEPATLAVGDPIPGTRYRMVRSLGSGGSAEVVCAQHVDLDRQVALKVLDPQLSANPEAIAQFRLEARACSRIGHPNIVDVIDFGELDDGRFFFAMEMVAGESLADLLARDRRLPLERAIAIFRQVAKAVQAAHDHYIIHRDLKPENVMLLAARDGRPDMVKLLDFGVMAFASDDGDTDRVGTPGYMAPEQVRGETPTPQMDIYAVGTTLYEVLCGELPYPGETLDEFAVQQGAAAPPALRSRRHGGHVPAAVERVVHRAIERDPQARQPSMADFEAELLQAQSEAAIETAWDDLTPPRRLRDSRKRPPAPPAPPAPGPADARPTGESPADRPANRWPARLVVGAAVAVALFFAVRLATRDRSPSRAGSASAPAQAPRAAVAAPSGGSAAPAASQPASAPASSRPAALGALRQQVLALAHRGEYTHPRGRSALDLLLAAELRWPGEAQLARLRRQLAGELRRLARQLQRQKLDRAARVLLRQAPLFERRRAAPAVGQGPGSAAAPARVRPPATTAAIAHLVARIQRAVAEGRYLQPARDNALHYLKQLRKLDPRGDHSEAHKLLERLKAQARALRRAGERARAEALQKAVAAAPSWAGHGERRQRLQKQLRAGRAALKAGELAVARRAFAAARDADPRNPDAHWGLAAVAFDAGRYEAAIKAAKLALRHNRRHMPSHLVLGDAHFRLKRLDDAERVFRAARRLSPKLFDRRLARVRAARGR